jgi:hypothetical protein
VAIFPNFVGKEMNVMRPILKINGIQDLHDARYCAAISISMLGFKFLQADDMVQPGAVAEIMDWLSGPEAVGEFEFETPAAINAATITAKVQRVSLPVDYPVALAAEIALPLLFRVELDEDLLAVSQIADLERVFPDALFELRSDAADASFPAHPVLDALLPKCLVVADAPDAVYGILNKRGVQPFGFTLGDFISEKGGGIDYTVCDDFAQQYFELA